MQILNSKKFYFLLSFIEGGSVMATELLGAKMLAPYFGSSLYVWATVLAITLGGLAAGYFFGGIVSYRKKKSFILFHVLLLAAVFTILMPFTSKIILWLIGMHSLIPSVILCSCVFLFPPVFMMGMVSPLIIRAITNNADEAGKVAGAIYAISTLGGIIATFAFGFYVIPTFGLTLPSIITGIVLGIIPLIILLTKKKIINSMGFVLLCIWAFSVHSSSSSPNIKTIYSSEGLLGQLMVLDYRHYSEGKYTQQGYNRWLLINRITQTMWDSLADETKQEQKYFPYVYTISNFADSMPTTSSALLLGLGGGSIAKKLIEKGFSVDVCELDERIAYVAKHYFYLSDKVNISVDDARHFIRTCAKKYDLIVMDMFRGEDIPNHVFTRESLQELKPMLNKNASIIINGFGYIDGNIGKSMRSIYKTFLAEGYKVRVMNTDKNPDSNNLLFFATLDELKSNREFISENKIELNDALILQDEYPVLDKLNAEAAKRWRFLSIESFLHDPDQRMLPVFQ